MRLVLRFAIVVGLTGVISVAAGAQSLAQKPRVFITDSQSWEMAGGVGGTSGGFGGASKGGARPQTGEIIKTFGQRCPQITVNNIREKADYIILLDHEGGKDAVSRDNKVVVFNKDGDSILSNSTRVLGNAVKDACAAIVKDWPARARKIAAEQANDPPAAASATQGRISVSSNPPGADIEVDGNFVGSTPSSIDLGLGDHVITVKKSGYQTWERKMRVNSGEIRIAAELAKTP
ncbi:MAG: PEGA domain-containing protein [Acidobacteria bacterium]|nr:PEGA domain-containing protein [Acidobacteriota bacterium]